jgi:cation-transporting ATPase I
MSSDAVLRLLDSTRRGLPQREAERRRREQPDEYGETEVSLGRATMEELATPLTPVLATGAGLSATAGSILDPLLITGVLLVNALIGGAQQLRTRRELRQLTARSAPTVRIHRGGPDAGELRTSSETVRADRLVVGEVIELHAGDAVPADCRLLVARGLEVDESSLTGESFPVAKTSSPTSAPTVADRTSMIYEGTVVATGRAIGVVVATGPSTEAGRTQRIIGEPVAKGGVQARLRTLTRRVLPASVAAGLALVGVDLLRGRGFGQTLARAVGLAVAAVPEGLPFVATVAELASARRLSARGTLVRNPGTIEALGRVDVLCFDKTGTLTEGRLGVRQVSDGTRAVPLDELAAEPEAPAARLRGVLAAAVRASPFHSGGYQVPHQTDRAVLRDAAHLGITANHDQGTVQHLDELAFEPGRGYHATLWRSESGAHISVKGAPEVILPLADSWRPGREPVPLDEPARRRIGAETERLARQGYRILAVAERASETTSQLHASAVAGLEFRGLLALADPVRPTAAQAVATLRAAGVEIMMITGDHPSTAESIAAELDALNGRRVLTGAELDALDDDALAAVLPELAVFARVTPEQKARIVRALRANGHAVAVTGDGANDAPAIRLADVGLALGEHATPAARQAADVVITDDRIETITDAIVEGRAMWASVRDALSILLGGNLGEIAYAVGTGLLDGGAALNARQLLLINMLTDVLPAMAVAVRPPPDISAHELLAEGPDASLGGALNRDIAVRAAITAISATVAWLLARPTSTLGQASTTGLVALVSAQLGQTLVVRGRTPLVAGAVVGSLLALAGIVQTPGVSHVAGCRPLLPHQWAIALTAAVVASAAQLVASRIVQHVIAQSPRGYSPLADRSPSTA